MARVQRCLCFIATSYHRRILHGHDFPGDSCIHRDPPVSLEGFSHRRLDAIAVVLPRRLALLHSLTCAAIVPGPRGSSVFRLLLGLVCRPDKRYIWAQW